MRHEIPEDEDVAAERTREGQGILAIPRYELDGVNDHVEGDARVTGSPDGDVAMALVRLVEPEARRVGLPESDAPRMIVAVREGLSTRRDARPFDPLSPAEAQLADALAPSSSQTSTSKVVEPLSIERTAEGLRKQLAALGKWWSMHEMGSSIAVFQMQVNAAGKIGPGGRNDASIEQLRAALRHARELVERHCVDHDLPRPRNLSSGEPS
jgi:hypothetical protein